MRNLAFVVYALSQAAAAASLAAGTSPLPPPVYTVSRSFPLGGSAGWDYLALEASGARLFVSRGDHRVAQIHGAVINDFASLLR